MRFTYVMLTVMSVVLAACQTGTSSGSSPTAADYKNAKPASADEEARFLAAGERQNRMAPVHVAASFDPSGISQNAAQAASRPDMEEMQRLMPAMHAKNKQRTTEFCALHRQTAECQEYEKLVREARAAGVDY